MNLWKVAKLIFELSSAQASSMSSEQITLVPDINLPLLKEINKAVGMFESLAK